MKLCFRSAHKILSNDYNTMWTSALEPDTAIVILSANGQSSQKALLYNRVLTIGFLFNFLEKV